MLQGGPVFRNGVRLAAGDLRIGKSQVEMRLPQIGLAPRTRV